MTLRETNLTNLAARLHRLIQASSDDAHPLVVMANEMVAESMAERAKMDERATKAAARSKAKAEADGAKQPQKAAQPPKPAQAK
jgi:hypothetical protein